MTADEILKELENIPAIQVEENNEETQYCEIDPVTREIYVPEQYAVIGVESDEKSNRIYFRCPKIVGDNIDLSKLQLRVNFRNALGDDTINAKDQYIVDDVETDGDNITFSWLLSRKVTKYKGEIDFIVCAVKVSGETITNEWNTTLAHSEVLEGLEIVTPQPSEEESDVIAQLLEIMSTTSAQAVEDVEDARTTALSDITTEKTESKQEILDYTQDMISTIPSDYTEMTEKVWYMDAHKAPAILETASGESLTIEDSGDAAIPGLKVYGKGVQYQGTSQNLFDLEKFLKDRGADYTKNADGSITLNTWKAELFNEPESFAEENGTYSLSAISIVGTAGIDITSLTSAETVYQINNATKKQENKSVGRIRLNYPSNPGFQKTTFRGVMLNEGASALPYEPYTGGQPAPSPDYPQEIKIPGSDGEIQVHTAGKNLLDYEKWKENAPITKGTGVYKDYGIVLTATADDCYTGYTYTYFKINVMPGKIYAFSWEAEVPGGSGSVFIFPNGISTRGKSVNARTGKIVYTAEEDVTFITFRVGVDNTGDTITYKNIMFSAEEEPSDFVPYQGPSTIPISTPNGLPGIPVDSGGNYTDEEGQQWVCDEIDLERGKYIQRVAKVEFDGETSGKALTFSDYNNDAHEGYHYASIRSNELYSGNLKAVSKIISNKMLYSSTGLAYIDKPTIYITSNMSFLLPDKLTGLASGDIGVKIVQNFNYVLKQWYSDGDPLIVYYQLDTPKETDLEPEEIAAFRSARTYPTVTNVMTDSDTPPGLEVTYAADTKTWIENKLTEIVQTQAATNAQILKEV